MHRGICLLVLALALSLAACQSETAPVGPSPGTGPLKDIEVSSSPSPYFHFAYDNAGRPTFVSYASGLLAYDIAYDSARISELRSIAPNHDRLVYTYDGDGHVAAVREMDSSGVVFTFVSLTYDGPRLVQLERDLRVTGGFLVIQTMTFAYDSGSHLTTIVDHRPAFQNQPETTTQDHFEDYEDSLNVDDFALLHTGFFDHVILLPELHLQHGNPRRYTRTGDGDNFTIDYAYAYDGQHRPLTKQGDILFTSGPLAGRHYATSWTFSYY